MACGGGGLQCLPYIRAHKAHEAYNVGNEEGGMV